MPAGRTSGASVANNLPIQLTQFIGRQKEVTAVEQMLRSPEVRLVVLTGPGGIGKTRLGLRAAARVMDVFPDGVFFTGLESIEQAHLVIEKIARQLGIPDRGARPVGDLLRDFVVDRQMLLVLDNFEHVMDAATSITDLLAAGRTLKILATSREILHLQGEHHFPVPPLSLSDDASAAVSEADFVPRALASDAVRLFADRATAARPDFALRTDNARVIGDICRRLDGLPLAIELAAARIDLLRPQQILERVDDSLSFLSRGHRDRPSRQQTLRASIEWSHDLLTESERVLFRRLAVFSGGFTLDAVEKACTPDGNAGQTILDEIASLKDKSLIRTDDSGSDSRFAMLETIREFAYERLEHGGELREVQRRHAQYFHDFAAHALDDPDAMHRKAWFTMLETEHGNLCSALAWFLESGPKELGVELIARLELYWTERGFSEGRFWTERAMSAGCDPCPALAHVFRDAGRFALELGDRNRGMHLIEQGLAMSRKLGDTIGTISALRRLGFWRFLEGDSERARPLLEDSVALVREIGDTNQLGYSLYPMAQLVAADGNLEYAKDLLKEGLARFEEDSNVIWASVLRMTLAWVAKLQGNVHGAAAMGEQSLAVFRQVEDTLFAAMSLELLGNCYLKLGDVERAKAALDEAIPLFGEMASRWGIGDGYDGFCHCLILCANIACARGRFERAVLLLGAATAAREPVDSWMESWRQLTESTLDEARSHLGDQRFAAAWERGKSLSVKEAVACTIEPPGGADQAATPAVAFATQQSGLFPDGLSRREVDVAVLLVEGLTNREIGGRLYISERTVANHVQSILNKTGSGNRAEAAAYAIRHGLTN